MSSDERRPDRIPARADAWAGIDTAVISRRCGICRFEPYDETTFPLTAALVAGTTTDFQTVS